MNLHEQWRDETTATRLLASAHKHDEYAGKVSNIVAASVDRQALEKRLAEFDGIGPKTVEISCVKLARYFSVSDRDVTPYSG